MCIKHTYNIVTNLQGDYCSKIKHFNDDEEEENGKMVRIIETNCPNSIWLLLSVANKLK